MLAAWNETDTKFVHSHALGRLIKKKKKDETIGFTPKFGVETGVHSTPWKKCAYPDHPGGQRRTAKGSPREFKAGLATASGRHQAGRRRHVRSERRRSTLTRAGDPRHTRKWARRCTGAGRSPPPIHGPVCWQRGDPMLHPSNQKTSCRRGVQVGSKAGVVAPSLRNRGARAHTFLAIIRPASVIRFTRSPTSANATRIRCKCIVRRRPLSFWVYYIGG